jgi:hypothetical protein
VRDLRSGIRNIVTPAIAVHAMFMAFRDPLDAAFSSDMTR